MKKFTLNFLVVSLLIGFVSCQLVDDIFEDESSKSKLNATKINSKLKLPEDAKIEISDITVFSFSDIINLSSSDSGKFQIGVAESEKPQVLFATNKENQPVLLGLVDPTSQNAEVSAESTAKSLILINPVFLLTSAYQRSEILSKATNHPDFDNLVSSIERLLETDPENILDLNVHPKIYEKAAEISIDIIKCNEISDVKSAGIKKKIPWIDSYQKNEISVFNPKTIYFAAEYSPQISQKNTHLIKAKSSLVSVGLTWPPIYVTEPTENVFQIEDDNNYQLSLTKGFDFSNPSELFNINNVNGKATLANTGKSLALLFDLVIGLDLPITGLLDIAIDSKRNLQIGIRMGNHFRDGDVMGIIYDVCDFTIANKDAIMFWIRQELNPANGDKLDERLTHVFSVMKNVAVVTKIVSIGSKAANEVIPFVYDLITVDRTIQYTFSIQKGHLSKTGVNSPPVITKTKLLKDELLVSSIASVVVAGDDNDDEEIAFRIHWGDGSTSEWSDFNSTGSDTDFSYSYKTPGTYQIVVEAKDMHGAIGELSDKIQVFVYSEDESFAYHFDNDIVGTHPSSPPWQISEKAPSYLRIAGTGSDGSGKSCEFIDYDPDIINNDDNGGVALLVLNNKLKNAGTVKFSCKVASKEDDFGIRAWQDDNYRWSEMGFYVSFHDGYICYYINGTFHKIMETTADKWYSFQIDYNTSAKKYDITVDGKLVAHDINYSGDPFKLSKFQIIAFSNASCRKANIDNIIVPVEYIKNGYVTQEVPGHATIISQ